MNILFVNHYAVPPTEPGGTRHWAIGRELVSRGYKVTILSSAFGHWRGGTDRSRLPEEVSGVRFIWLRTPAYSGNGVGRLVNMLTFAFAALWSRKVRREVRPDVVVGSSPHPFAALAAQLVARRSGAKFVFEVRDIWPESLVAIAGVSPRHPLVMLLGWIERHLCRTADALVTLLPGAAGHLTSRGARPERIFWIPNGADTKLFPAGPAPRRSGARINVVHAGSIGEANAPDTILEAATILDELSARVNFEFVGDGPLRARLEAEARRRGLRNVKFLGAVPRADVPGILQRADVGIAAMRDRPLYANGVSLNKIFDYMAASCPVVFAADVPQNPVLESGGGIVVAPEEPKELAAALQAIASLSSDERSALGEAGRTYVLRHHSAEALAGRYEEVFRCSGTPQ